MIGWCVPSPRAYVGKGGSVQAEQILMVIKTKKGAGAGLAVMEESFLNDASKLERKIGNSRPSAARREHELLYRLHEDP